MELTEREKQTARLLLEGKTPKQIADTLGVSKRAVDKYLARLREKTGFPNTSLKAAHLANARGMLK